jgi:long-chain acyl-CoA synthetase
MTSLNLSDVFVGVANRWRERLAIVSPRRRLSYADLIAVAAQSARELRNRGIGPGTNVGIATHESADYLILMIAIWMLDATAVPIDFRSRPSERSELKDEFNLFAILEDRHSSASRTYESVIVDDAWYDSIAAYNAEPLFVSPRSAPAIISLTSGTTGKPAGIVLDHERLLLQLSITIAEEIDPGPRMLSALPVSFAATRNRTLNRLLNGATVYFLPPLFSTEEFAEAIQATSATFVFAVPTIIRSLLELYGDRATPAFATVQALGSGGAPIAPDEKRHARTALSPHYFEEYGSSICGVISTLYGADIEARPETVGRVRPHIVAQIVDNEDVVVRPGDSGYIRVRSPGMARCIYGDESRNTGDRIKDGWIYTGDIGVLDVDQFLQVIGRSSEVIIRAGSNVHPSEIESVILKYPGVRETVATGYSQPREGEDIAVFVITDPGVTETALVAHCRAHLTPDRRPRKIIFVSELPRNANGKILRTDLRKRLEQDSP